jgi:hypothetical protein
MAKNFHLDIKDITATDNFETIMIKNELLHLLPHPKVPEPGEKESGRSPDQKLFHLDG